MLDGRRERKNHINQALFDESFRGLQGGGLYRTWPLAPMYVLVLQLVITINTKSINYLDDVRASLL